MHLANRFRDYAFHWAANAGAQQRIDNQAGCRNRRLLRLPVLRGADAVNTAVGFTPAFEILRGVALQVLGAGEEERADVGSGIAQVASYDETVAAVIALAAEHYDLQGFEPWKAASDELRYAGAGVLHQL